MTRTQRRKCLTLFGKTRKCCRDEGRGKKTANADYSGSMDVRRVGLDFCMGNNQPNSFPRCPSTLKCWDQRSHSQEAGRRLGPEEGTVTPTARRGM